MRAEGSRRLAAQLGERMLVVDPCRRVAHGGQQLEPALRGQRAGAGIKDDPQLAARQRHPAGAIRLELGDHALVPGVDRLEENAGTRPQRTEQRHLGQGVGDEFLLSQIVEARGGIGLRRFVADAVEAAAVHSGIRDVEETAQRRMRAQIGAVLEPRPLYRRRVGGGEVQIVPVVLVDPHAGAQPEQHVVVRVVLFPEYVVVVFGLAVGCERKLCAPRRQRGADHEQSGEDRAVHDRWPQSGTMIVSPCWSTMFVPGARPRM